MMDAIKEESVGFLFNLEVEVEDTDAAPDSTDAPGELAVPGGPQLDPVLLEKAAQAHAESNGAAEKSAPHVTAKGLDRDVSAKPLVYSSPELGSDSPSVTTSGGEPKTGGTSATARRQQARSNPNRGSRGNRRKR
jgi:preprotein translocase subunit SecA